MPENCIPSENPLGEFPEASPGDDFNAQIFYIKNNLDSIFSLSTFTQMTSFHPPATPGQVMTLSVWKGKTEKLPFQNLGPSTVGTG